MQRSTSSRLYALTAPNLTRWILLGAVFCGLPTACIAEPPATTQTAALDRADRIAVLRHDVEAVCSEVLADPPDAKQLQGRGRRDLTHIAHDLFVLDNNPAADKEAQSLISAAFDGQDMDPASAKFGTVSWNVGGARTPDEDKNAIEFTCLPVGAILSRYRARLSPEFMEQIKPHLVAALSGVQHHRVGMAYTNIYLMQITNLLLLGEAMGDDDSARLAMQHLDMWIDFTRKNGIAEFNSPTYMETQINSVTTAYDCTKSAATKTKLRHVLDLLWVDACASYDPATQQLGGASSRDYSFIYGSGPVDRYLFLEGLRSLPPTTTLINDMSGPFCDAIETDYRPDEKMLALARNPEKQFRAGFPWPDAWGDRTYFSTAAFSLGSSAVSYDTQDRMVGLRFGSGKPLPVVSIFLDRHDNPDGTTREKVGDNRGKSVHWKMRGATVQDRATVLGIEDISSNLLADTESLGLNLILPAHADELWLDAARIDPQDLSEHPCDGKSIVIVREGNAAMARRLFDVGGFAGQAPTYFLKHDIAGGDAFRLVAYAYHGERRTLTDHPVSAGFILQAARCDTDSAFADFVAHSRALADISIEKSDSQWSAHFGSIAAAFDPKTGKPIQRTVGGADVHQTGLETVNGWDFRELLPP